MSRGFHARTGATGGGRPHHCGRRGAMLAVALLVVALESTMVLPATGTTVVDDYTSLSLEQLMSIPVYSAAKREQKTSEAPSSVTVVTSQDAVSYTHLTLPTSDLV